MNPTRLAPRLLFTVLLCTSLPLQAAFITDRIEVPVHVEKYNQGRVLKKLLSGTQVDVLMKDGQYTRIRTSDGASGWVESRYLSDEKPLGLEYLELRSQYKLLQDELLAARQKLSEAEQARETASQSTGPEISAEELADLRKRANDTRWMKAEMNKARERAKKLEAELKTLRARASKQGESRSAAQKELEQLRAQNKELETRLAAALLVNEELSAAETVTEEAQESPTAEADLPVAAATVGSADAWSVGIEWFLGGVLIALVAGGIGGASWLDRRIRARHGGFRIY